MKTQVSIKTYLTAILLLALGVLVSCSTFSAADAGYTLEYGKEIGKVTTYTITGNGTSTLEFQGQIIDQSESLSGTATHVVTGASSNILDHELTYSKLSINAGSDLTGILTLDLSSIIGVPLKITSGKLGENIKFLNFKDIPSIEVPVPVHLNLIELLPVLPTDPVNTADTWKGIREHKIETINGELAISSEIDYLFAGIEERLGFECIKITATDNTTVSGTGKSQGMNIEFSGFGINTNTYYFAHKEGILIEFDSQTSISMSVSLLDMGETIPLEGTGTLNLVYVK